MRIWNIIYSVISQGIGQPARRPEEGDTVNLSVRRRGVRAPYPLDTSHDAFFASIGYPEPPYGALGQFETAVLTVRHVSDVGPYAQVQAIGRVGDREELALVAHYDVRDEYEQGTEIGELVLKYVVRD